MTTDGSIVVLVNNAVLILRHNLGLQRVKMQLLPNLVISCEIRRVAAFFFAVISHSPFIE